MWKQQSLVNMKMWEILNISLEDYLKSRTNAYLHETMWSMLPDARLTSQGRKKYKEYRDYLRDFFQIREQGQLKNPDHVMSFEEWLEDPPIYKLEPKMIL
jgi:hypothetical protein